MKKFYPLFVLLFFSVFVHAATFVAVESTEVTDNGEFRVVALSDTVPADQVIGQYRYSDGMGGFNFSGFSFFNFLEDAGNGNFRFELTFTVPPGENIVEVELCNENSGAVFNCTGFVSTVVGLPVELSAFSGDTSSGGIELRWTTQTEENVSHFDIERSVDGVSFEKIGEKSAVGESSSTLNYSFVDGRAQVGEIFYRLHIIDKDGRSEYSKIISVNISGGKERLLAFNLFSRSLTVVSETLCSTSGDIQVVGRDGQVVFQQVFRKNELCGSAEIVMDGLSSGLFYVRVTTERGVKDTFCILIQ